MVEKPRLPLPHYLKNKSTSHCKETTEVSNFVGDENVIYELHDYSLYLTFVKTFGHLDHDTDFCPGLSA